MTKNNNLKEKDLYFGSEVDEAISIFLSETDNKKRNKIFEQTIYPALEKLSRYHYYKFPIAKNEEVISECVSFLYEQLHKFDPEKNTRGFPYFNIIAKHFYIGKLKNENREIIRDNDIVSLNDAGNITEESNLFTEDFEEDIEEDQFLKIFKSQLHVWKSKFNKKNEVEIVDALIEMFENADNIDIYKKKAIFFYLKEQTRMNSKQIAINLNKIKKKFKFLKNKYDRGDI